MRIECPDCQTAYTLPVERIPAHKAIAKCKRCGGKIVIDPGEFSAGDAPMTAEKYVSSDKEAHKPSPPAETARQSRAHDPGKDMEAYIGPKAEKYMHTFKRFTGAGRARFKLTWHWPAALVGFWWLLYRKLYLWAFVAIVLTSIPLANVLAVIGFGLGGNYLYFRQASRKIGELRSALPDANLEITLRHLGGVNRWVMVVGIVLGGVGAVGMLASVIMTVA
jgi:predicted Zn finger-like uncharacterized protein